MTFEDIEIVIGDLERPYDALGIITVRDVRYTWWGGEPNTERVNGKLREVAATHGANAVINVTYERKGWTLLPPASGTLIAHGVAVRAEPPPPGGSGPSTKVCPDCAETVLAEARICRFCRYEFGIIDATKGG